MATAVKTDTLAAAMAAAFAEIEKVTKEAENPAFKRDGKALKYADLGAVIDAIKPPLIKHQLFFTQQCHPAEDGVSVETVLHHAGGDTLSLGVLYLPANKRDAQGFGSALTYARRYALMTAFGVPAEDDDGNAASASVRNGAAANDRNGNGDGHQVKAEAARNAPFPQGPAKNRTELKTLGRAYWRDIEGAGDEDSLDIVLDTNRELHAQIAADLPSWISGGTRDGEAFEGLDAVIVRKRAEFTDDAWKRNPLNGG